MKTKWNAWHSRHPRKINAHCVSRPMQVPSEEIFKAVYNQSIAKEIKDLMHRLNNEGKLDKFDEIVAYGNILCEKKGQGQYILKQVLQ